MTPTDPIAGLIERARRRVVWNVALAQGVVAACLAAAGAILILVLGTQLLDWWWLALLAGAGVGTGIWRARRLVPSRYRVAQQVDGRLKSNDALATAWFFAQPGNRTSSEPVCIAQRAMAERIAAAALPAAAVPLEAPPRTTLLGMLALAALGLFTLRYGLERRLDVRAPLTQVLFDTFTGRFEQRAAVKKRNIPGFDWQRPTPDTPTQEAHTEEPGTYDPSSAPPLEGIDIPDVQTGQAGQQEGSGRATGKAAGNEPGETEPVEPESSESSGETGSQGSGRSDREGSAGPQQAAGAGSQPPGSPPDSSSLANKLRDAMANLLSRMRPQGGAGSKRQAPGAQGKQPSTQASASMKGSASMGQNQSGGQQSGESQEGQAGEEATGGQSADNQTSGKGDEQSSQSPGSGIGKQDGAKEIKLAEQLAAMGKISEIIGKRSATVTGDVTIEVQSTRQQLRTPYSSSRATHALAGAEINRDEVPAASQHYVQQYFERIRRPTPAPPAGGPKSARE